MSSSRYLIPKKRTRVELRVSNSRFIATIGPASSVKEAQEFIKGLREEMPDATHHVYAFKIGFGASVSEGMSDDGEPSGTAGPPALSVVRGSGIGDVVVVITRYFGGTKLGTGGLVSAYSESTKAAFEEVETEEKVNRLRFELAAPYAILEQVRRLLTECQAILENERYEEKVHLGYLLPEEMVDRFAESIKDMTAGQITPRQID